MVAELICKMHAVLNIIKDFEVGYSTRNIDNGYMLIEYKGKRYAVRAVEITDPAKNAVDDVDKLEYIL